MKLKDLFKKRLSLKEMLAEKERLEILKKWHSDQANEHWRHHREMVKATDKLRPEIESAERAVLNADL